MINQQDIGKLVQVVRPNSPYHGKIGTLKEPFVRIVGVEPEYWVNFSGREVCIFASDLELVESQS